MISSSLFSIGMPTYNSEKYIGEAINSLLSQEYKNFELIISNNSSDDNTEKICKAFMKKDKRIRYFKQKKNIGATRNFNFVLSKAKGKYFMWAASDDLWDKNYIKTLIVLFKKNKNATLAVSNYTEFNETIQVRKKLKIVNPFPKISVVSFLNSTPSAINSLFYGVYKKNILKKIGGLHLDERPIFEGSSDKMTVFKVLMHGELVHSEKFLFKKRDSGNYLDSNEKLKEFKYNESLSFKIKRFLLHPIFYSYDLLYSFKEVGKASLSYKEKLIICLYVVKFYLVSNIVFLKIGFLGMWSITLGIINKFFRLPGP